MKSMRNKLPILLAMLMFTGCTSIREVRLESLEEATKRQGYGAKRHMTANLSEVYGDSVKFEDYAEVREKRVELIERGLLQMGIVESANVVIIENSAVVSVNFTDAYKGRELTKLKRQIKNKVKEIDKSLRFVSVTASPEIIERLHDITTNRKQNPKNTVTSLRPSI